MSFIESDKTNTTAKVLKVLVGLGGSQPIKVDRKFESNTLSYLIFQSYLLYLIWSLMTTLKMLFEGIVSHELTFLV